MKDYVSEYAASNGFLPGMTIPSRRHKCEICSVVFECHLCELHEMTIQSGSFGDHILHKYLPLTSDEIRSNTKYLQHIFVCEDCVILKGLIYVYRAASQTGICGRLRRDVWNQLTGERVAQNMLVHKIISKGLTNPGRTEIP